VTTADREKNAKKRGKPFEKGNTGRPKGVPNKTTTLLKDAILLAAENAGGADGMVGYLQEQAAANPSAFMTLLGKVLPLQLTGADGRPIDVSQRHSPEAVKAFNSALDRMMTELAERRKA
jgi:hypothetical protein